MGFAKNGTKLLQIFEICKFGDTFFAPRGLGVRNNVCVTIHHSHHFLIKILRVCNFFSTFAGEIDNEGY